MDALARLRSSPDVEARPPRPGAVEWIESQSGLRLPEPVRRLFDCLGGAQIKPLSIRLLPPSEVLRLLENWPRFGFSKRWGYLPLAEDESGDLYCVCCGAILWERVCRLQWAGEDDLRYRTVDSFLQELVRLLDSPPDSRVLQGDYDLPGARDADDLRAAAELLELAADLPYETPDRTAALVFAERLSGNRPSAASGPV